MNYIDELIKKHCPDGVSYKPFGQLATIVRGASPRPIKNFITLDSSGINWIKIGDVKPGIKYITETAEKITIDGAKKSRYVHAGDFILSNSMSFGRPYILKINGCIHDGWLAISDFQKTFLPDFLYHLLNSNTYQSTMRQKASFGGAVQNLNADIIRDLEMPLVPLEVQREIVRILDSFTSLTAELSAKLSAELSARQKQYGFYREKLLLKHSSSKHVKILDMLSQPITDGPHTTPTFVSDGIPFISVDAIWDGKIHFEKMRGYITPEFDKECSKKYKPKKNDVYMVKSGSTTGKVAFVDTDRDFNIWSPLAAMRVNSNYLSRYLFHLLQTDFIQNQIKAKSSHGSQPNLSMRVLEQIEVDVPPLDVQQRIVNVLDNFDAICSDLNIGLPAEISARQKQYEYYRDVLLSFKNIDNITDRQTDRQTEHN